MTATRKTCVVRPTSSTIRLDGGESLLVGVEARKATYHVALLGDRRGLGARETNRAASPPRRATSSTAENSATAGPSSCP